MRLRLCKSQGNESASVILILIPFNCINYLMIWRENILKLNASSLSLFKITNEPTEWERSCSDNEPATRTNCQPSLLLAWYFPELDMKLAFQERSLNRNLFCCWSKAYSSLHSSVNVRISHENCTHLSISFLLPLLFKLSWSIGLVE